MSEIIVAISVHIWIRSVGVRFVIYLSFGGFHDPVLRVRWQRRAIRVEDRNAILRHNLFGGGRDVAFVNDHMRDAAQAHRIDPGHILVVSGVFIELEVLTLRQLPNAG